MKVSWTHVAVKYDNQVSAEFAKQSYSEGPCQCLMQEFQGEILHPSSYARQSVGVQSHLHAAPFHYDWTWPVTCNLLLDKHEPEIAPKQTYAWSLLSGKHSGVAMSGYQYKA